MSKVTKIGPMFILIQDTEGRRVVINAAHVTFMEPCHITNDGLRVDIGDTTINFRGITVDQIAEVLAQF